MFEIIYTVNGDRIASQEYETEEDALEIISEARKYITIHEIESNKWTWYGMGIEIIEELAWMLKKK